MMNVTSPRLALLGTLNKGFYKGESTQIDEIIVDDSNDHLYQNEFNRKPFYGIIRPRISSSVSLMKMINYFGYHDGFDILLNKIQSIENPMPIEPLTNYLSGLGNIHALYVKMFAKNYIPKLKDAVLINLLQSPENNIRNMAKEKLDTIIKAMENLLKRAYSLGYKFEFVEKLSLDLAILCFKSNFLDKKV